MSRDLRCLTVRQPWPWAIIHGGKDVENRTRNIAGTYRGPVAIHAGLTVASAADYRKAIDELAPDAWAEYVALPYAPLGAVIGVVDLVAVHHADTCFRNPSGPCSPWSQPHAYHLALTNPRPCRNPIPTRGRLGLWRPDQTLAEAIWDEVPA